MMNIEVHEVRMGRKTMMMWVCITFRFMSLKDEMRECSENIIISRYKSKDCLIVDLKTSS
ncbi:hypothetical protein MALU111345_13785 [Marinicrinis lubricantis]